MAGAISGAVARVVIGPLDVLKVRFQVQLEPIRKATSAGQPLSKYTGISQALQLIVKEEGIQVNLSSRLVTETLLPLGVLSMQ